MENLINGVLYSVLKNKIKREAVDVKQILDQIAETLLPEKDFEIAIKNTRVIVAKILLQQVFQ
jgi:hypothetical protein